MTVQKLKVENEDGPESKLEGQKMVLRDQSRRPKRHSLSRFNIYRSSTLTQKIVLNHPFWFKLSSSLAQGHPLLDEPSTFVRPFTNCLGQSENSTWYWPDVNSCPQIHLNACFKIFIWKARLYRGYESLLNLKVVSAVFGVSYSWIPKWTFWIFATCFYTNKNTPRTNKNFNDHYITECICEYSIKILNNATFNCQY